MSNPLWIVTVNRTDSPLAGKWFGPFSTTPENGLALWLKANGLTAQGILAYPLYQPTVPAKKQSREIYHGEIRAIATIRGGVLQCVKSNLTIDVGLIDWDNQDDEARDANEELDEIAEKLPYEVF